MKEKVVVGLSGGVDSAVAAHLLLEQGYDVIGVTMQMLQDENCPLQEGSPAAAMIRDAKEVADRLGIPHHVINFKKVFDKNVVNYFINEYLQGHTPNPCIVCNRFVKWEALLDRSRELGATYIATGHYATIKKLENDRFTLQVSSFKKKDQTYALYQLTQEQLKSTLMPNGLYSKEQIREIAAAQGLIVANKPDSQEICFIPDNDYAGFIEKNAENVPPAGNFVSTDGEILGQHKGITHYTIGQRKGLGIAFGHPVFVSEIRPETNEVVLGATEDLMKSTVIANGVNWMAVEDIGDEKVKALGKIRYNQKQEACYVENVPGTDNIKVTFERPQRAVTPGQSVVLYTEDDSILGGGTIIG